MYAIFVGEIKSERPLAYVASVWENASLVAGYPDPMEI